MYIRVNGKNIKIHVGVMQLYLRNCENDHI